MQCAAIWKFMSARRSPPTHNEAMGTSAALTQIRKLSFAHFCSYKNSFNLLSLENLSSLSSFPDTPPGCITC